MGYSYRSDDTPKMCYNPAKNWQLDWYIDKQLEIDPIADLCIEPTSFILNGIVDYENTAPGGNVILKVDDFFYLGFNKASDFNSESQEAKNQVTVHEKLGSPNSATISKLVKGLSIGGTYDIEISSNLQVRVRYVQLDNSKDAVIELSLLGSAATTCTVRPTLSPTETATESPTKVPTPPPTPARVRLLAQADHALEQDSLCMYP